MFVASSTGLSNQLANAAAVTEWESRFQRCNVAALRYVSLGLGLVTVEDAAKIITRPPFVKLLTVWVSARSCQRQLAHCDLSTEASLKPI